LREPRNPGEAVLHPKLAFKDAKAITGACVCVPGYSKLTPAHDSWKESITLRVVSNTDCPGTLEPRVSRWVEAQSKVVARHMPLNFPYRAKTIAAFQRRDGIDVLVYAVYVQEYPLSCPDPNAGNVYLSYLDSVGCVAVAGTGS
jgi:hypothetical protein